MSDTVGKSELLSRLIADMRVRWRAGDKVLAESYIQQHAELQSDDGLLGRLVLVEFQLSRECGDHPDRADYCKRFPQAAYRLQDLLGSEPHEAETSRPAHGSNSTHLVGSPQTGQNSTASFDQPGRTNIRAEPGVGVAVPLGRFGGYELLEEIARGGMGIVYKARQIKANRTVALKMILAGQLASTEDVKRFETEASAAATLDHPNIVPIFEVGEHEGRHFYSMGLVDGQSLSDILRDGPLAPKDAARLMRQVAHAVEYAHAQGVIHRDLKPQNILLSRDGSPRVADFGLAKQLSGTSELTATGQILGTPNFMSPEQARGDSHAIGPLSDVYSLGAVLYCLLTGRPPFQAANVIETLRQVVTQEPVSPRLLNGAIDLDLETITLKCLQKEPAKRYASAAKLTDDLDRFLIGKPIEARPVARIERVWRWCRRNPLAASLSAAVTLLLLISAIGGTTLALIANQYAVRERAALKAESERAEGERRARDSAEKRLVQLEKGNEILGSIFRELDPWTEEKEGKSLRVLLGERLDQATEGLGGEAVGDPLVMAKLQMTLGESLLGLGYADKAASLLTKARATYTATLGPKHLDTLTSMNDLAEAYTADGKPKLAMPLLLEVFRLRGEELGPQHAATLSSMNSLGLGYLEAGNLSAAVPLLEEAVRLRRLTLGAEHADTLTSTDNLAVAFREAGKIDRALPLFEEVLRQRRAKLAPEHPLTLTSINNLAAAFRYAGKPDLAIPLYAEALQSRKVKLGPEHPNTLATMDNLAVAYSSSGKLELAVPLFEEAFKHYKAKMGPEHPDTLISMCNLAGAYRDSGKLDRAVSLLEEALRLSKAKQGLKHPETITTMHNLAKTYQAAGKLDLALPLYEQTLELLKSQRGPDHPYTIIGMNSLAGACRATGNLDRAVSLLQEALRLSKARLGPDHSDTQRTARSLGSTLLQAGKPSEAEPLLRGCLVVMQSKQPEDWVTFETRSLLGAALLGQKKQMEAEPLLLSGYEGMKQREAKISLRDKLRLTEALERIVQLYVAENESEKAAAWRQKLQEAKAATVSSKTGSQNDSGAH
ncbi:MAG TPA: tetratricopeptide repeat protein [Planctomycetaceae bacterium]|jgi:serine/threonine protein kinase|nr:tetratricopeptide repeat protein [Planctomycetaceae bacterium]